MQDDSNLPNARGFFDPISLGLIAPTNYGSNNKYLDEPALASWATYFHELTHYIQFYGTTFGLSYLIHVWMASNCFSYYTKQLLLLKKKVTTPLYSIAKSFIMNDIIKDKEENLWFNISLLNRYFCEELYGATYYCFGLEQIGSYGKIVISSPLYLKMKDDSIFAVTGTAILEHQAALNEIKVIANFPIKNISNNVASRFYGGNDKSNMEYFGISTWLHSLKIDHLEELFYFILLNQSYSNIPSRLGLYELITNLKKIIFCSEKIKKIRRPNSDDEINEAIESICKITKLKNPFNQLKGFLKKLKIENEHNPITKTVTWIGQQVIEWIILHPRDILYWPNDPKKIINKIPIWKIRPLDFKTEYEFNYYNWDYKNGKEPTEEEIMLIQAHSKYGDFVNTIQGLFFSERVKCPYFIFDKPQVCELCNECSGWIPDKVLKRGECPLRKNFYEHGIEIDRIIMPKGEQK